MRRRNSRTTNNTVKKPFSDDEAEVNFLREIAAKIKRGSGLSKEEIVRSKRTLAYIFEHGDDALKARYWQQLSEEVTKLCSEIYLRKIEPLSRWLQLQQNHAKAQTEVGRPPETAIFGQSEAQQNLGKLDKKKKQLQRKYDERSLEAPKTASIKKERESKSTDAANELEASISGQSEAQQDLVKQTKKQRRRQKKAGKGSLEAKKERESESTDAAAEMESSHTETPTAISSISAQSEALQTVESESTDAAAEMESSQICTQLTLNQILDTQQKMLNQMKIVSESKSAIQASMDKHMEVLNSTVEEAVNNRFNVVRPAIVKDVKMLLEEIAYSAASNTMKDVFSHKAASRVDKTVNEHLTKVVPSFRKAGAESMKAQMGENFSAIIDNMEPKLQGVVNDKLTKIFKENVDNLICDIDSTFQRELDGITVQIKEVVDNLKEELERCKACLPPLAAAPRN